MRTVPGAGDSFFQVEVALDPATRDRDDAFVSFFEAEYDGLDRTLLLTVGDRGEADDLAQEAMARVFERWDRVRAMGSPAGYAYAVAFNLNRRRIRRLGAWLRRAPSAEPPAEGSLDAADARRDVRDALLRLPLPLREAVVLTEWLGLSTEEAAAVMRIEPVTVRGRLHRARNQLRELLGDDDG